MPFRFQNRAEAGRLLADKLASYAARPEVIVLGLPRGGVVVASEVAQKLGVQLDVFIVRKLSAPGHQELAMGAIASGAVCFLNNAIIETLRIQREEIDVAIASEQRELERREAAYRTAAPAELRDRVIILVDDGLATGATMRAAVLAVRKHDPQHIVVAVPVAETGTVQEFQREIAETVCVQARDDFEGVGQWYEDFTQTSDEEVRALLADTQTHFRVSTLNPSHK